MTMKPIIKITVVALFSAFTLFFTGCSVQNTATIDNLTISYPKSWNASQDSSGYTQLGVAIPSSTVIKPTENPESIVVLSDASTANMTLNELMGKINPEQNDGRKVQEVSINGKRAVRAEGTDGSGTYYIMLVSEKNNKAAGMLTIFLTESEYTSNYDTYDSIISNARIS